MRTQSLVVRALDSVDVVRVVAYVSFVDLLFAPYLPVFIVPLSLPLMLATLPLIRLDARDRDFQAVLIVAVCVCASAGLSGFYRDSVFYTENLKRAGQFLTSLPFFFVYREAHRRQPLQLKPILALFITYFTLWVVYFIMRPLDALLALGAIYHAPLNYQEELAAFLRFPFAFSDPNTAAYFFLVAIGLFFVLRPARIAALATGLATIATLVVCQSRGAVLATLAAVVFSILRGYFGGKISVVRLIGILAAGVILAWFSVGLLANAVGSPEQKSLLSLVQDRFFGETSHQNSRPGWYWWLFTEHLLLPLGTGYMVLRDGAPFGTHSDHFRFLYGYGFLAWGGTVYLLFRDMLGRAAPFAIPALVAFSINSLVDEQKLFCLFLCALGVIRAESHSVSKAQSWQLRVA